MRTEVSSRNSSCYLSAISAYWESQSMPAESVSVGIQHASTFSGTFRSRFVAIMRCWVLLYSSIAQSKRFWYHKSQPSHFSSTNNQGKFAGFRDCSSGRRTRRLWTRSTMRLSDCSCKYEQYDRAGSKWRTGVKHKKEKVGSSSTERQAEKK
jgi:hypothetical protein